MIRDFTLTYYIELIKILFNTGYYFQSSPNLIYKSKIHSIILRHDVDRLPQNALEMARTESEMEIKSTYYFRMKPFSYDEEIIIKIANLGHEIGYHYENLSDVNKREKGKRRTKEELYKMAIENFQENLDKFRKIYPIKTICMHGSPLANVDNRDLWKVYDYRYYGIMGEPYFDIDYNHVLYITDAGRRWNNENVNRRDRVNSRFNYRFKATQDIIEAIKSNMFPDKIMMNIHPHNWSDNYWNWLKILAWQETKNVAKKILIFFNEKKNK